MQGLQPWHLLVLLVVILVLFGGKKLPEAARGLGKSMRIFKSEVKGMQDDDKARETGRDTTSGTSPLEGRVVGAADPPAPSPVREPDPVRAPDERRPGL